MKLKLPRGVLRVQDLYSHSERRPGSKCWWWLGAISSDKRGNTLGPRVWTFCHTRGEKRALSGPLAVFNIAHKAAPPQGHSAYMRCMNSMCVRPECVGSGTRAQIGAAIAASGKRMGTHIEARRVCAAKGRLSQGIVDTPEHLVLAVLEAPSTETGTAVAQRLGLSRHVVSKIRQGKTRAEVLERRAA